MAVAFAAVNTPLSEKYDAAVLALEVPEAAATEDDDKSEDDATSDADADADSGNGDAFF